MTTTRSRRPRREAGSARRAAASGAGSACLERDPPRPSPVGNSSRRSRRSRSAARRPTRNAIEGHRSIRAQEEKKEDDEELPERLKGCDKELVKRIEQEVIDSGSPVTFEDVAGLADAKRSIQVRDPAQRT